MKTKSSQTRYAVYRKKLSMCQENQISPVDAGHPSGQHRGRVCSRMNSCNGGQEGFGLLCFPPKGQYFSRGANEVHFSAVRGRIGHCPLPAAAQGQAWGGEAVPAVALALWVSQRHGGDCEPGTLTLLPQQTLPSFAKCTQASQLVSAYVSLMEVPFPESLNKKKKY